MRTRQQLISLRISHVTLMFACALFVYQYSQWEDGLWIPISVLAVIGPFRPGLTINKAKQRMLGSLAGLLLSLIVWFILHYNYNLLVVVAVVLVYCVAFSVLQDYSYFIFLVTLMLSINFDYMNLFFNNELSYIANRGMCVLTGVALTQFFEYAVFRHYYTNATALVESARLDSLLLATWQKVSSLVDHEKVLLASLNACLAPLLNELSTLGELKDSCCHSYSHQEQTLALIERYELKLQTMYNWLSAIGYSLLTENPQLAINKRASILPSEVDN